MYKLWCNYWRFWYRGSRKEDFYFLTKYSQFRSDVPFKKGVSYILTIESPSHKDALY